MSIDKTRKVIYAKELLYRTGMTTSDIYEVNRRHAGDALIIGDSAEPRLIEELRQKGTTSFGAVKGQGSVSGRYSTDTGL